MIWIKAQCFASLTLTIAGVLPVVDEDTLLPLGAVVAGVALAVKITWRVASRFTRYADRLEQLENRQKQLDRRKDPPAPGGGGSNP